MEAPLWGFLDEGDAFCPSGCCSPLHPLLSVIHSTHMLTDGASSFLRLSFGAGICAERNAIFQAVSKGKKAFETIAVVGGKCQENGGIQVDGFCYPCGICLQVMEEFCEDDFQVIFADSADLEVANIQVRTLKELMPYGFKL